MVLLFENQRLISNAPGMQDIAVKRYRTNLFIYYTYSILVHNIYFEKSELENMHYLSIKKLLIIERKKLP